MGNKKFERGEEGVDKGSMVKGPFLDKKNLKGGKISGN